MIQRLMDAIPLWVFVAIGLPIGTIDTMDSIDRGWPNAATVGIVLIGMQLFSLCALGVCKLMLRYYRRKLAELEQAS